MKKLTIIPLLLFAANCVSWRVEFARNNFDTAQNAYSDQRKLRAAIQNRHICKLMNDKDRQNLEKDECRQSEQIIRQVTRRYSTLKSIVAFPTDIFPLRGFIWNKAGRLAIILGIVGAL